MQLSVVKVVDAMNKKLGGKTFLSLYLALFLVLALGMNILLVIDKSGSMSLAFAGSSGPTRWQVLNDALAAALEPLKPLVNLGLLMHPDPRVGLDCDAATCCAMSASVDPDVPIGPGSDAVPTITTALAIALPGGATPTAEALQRAHDYYTRAAPEGDKYIILITDGAPNCNPDLACTADACTRNLDGIDTCLIPSEDEDVLNCCANPNTACVDEERTRSAIQSLLADGISTVVVGIPGSEPYAEFLAGFAQAGGHEPASGQAYYYAAAEDGTAGLVQVFTDIAAQVVSSCEIPLEQQPDDISKVNLAVDCVALARDDPDFGWHFDDNSAPTAIILEAGACDRIRSAGVARIDVLFACRAIF